MRHSCLLFFVLCISCNPKVSVGQKLWPVKFDRITTDDGLSQGMVNAILQDKYGFMWFASNDGLNRYDGNHFTVFKNDPNDNNSIAENFIRFLFEDAVGRIWIATAGNGLDLFDRETETFIHFKYNSKNLNSISDNSITCIDEDHAGGIWIGTLHGLNRLVINNKKPLQQTKKMPGDATELFLNQHTVSFTKIIFDTAHQDREIYSRSPDFPLADWRASNFHVDEQGLIWVSAQAKLFRIKPLANSNYQLDYLDVNSYMPLSTEKTDFEKYVQNFIAGSSPAIFYMVFQNGITEVNSATGKLKVLATTRVSNGIYSFPSTLDNSGNVWTSDESITLCFNMQTNSWQQISSDKNTADILKYVSCSYKDKAGNIWIGTKGFGLLRYDPAKKNFNKTDDRYIRFMSAGINEKILFIKDPYDELFWQFNRETNSITIPVPMSALPKRKFTHLGNTTKSVLQDKDGSYWIGRIGLYHYDQDKKITEYWHNYDDVFPLYDDDRNNLWFGNTNGLVHFDKLTKVSTEYTFPAKTTMGPYDYLQAIYRDKQGILWLGTLQGLYRFDPANKGWKQFKNIAGNLTSLSNNLIFCISPDPIQPGEYLWIGTKGGGLNRFNQTTGTFDHYTEKQGLSNDVVYGILGDSTGDLWVSTNKGISQFNTRTKAFKNYNVNDGLQGNEYNRNAFCKTANGYLYFGGTTGFNYFDPAKLAGSNYVPFVWITGINVFNKPLLFGQPPAVLQKPAYLTDSIILNYEQNMISFEFASTDFSAFHNNLFQYQLLGFDADWIYSGVKNTATYTNLDPGTYELRVRGSNSNGVWNEQPTRLTITVLPPWYLTWWFRISVLALLFSIAYGFHRYRLLKILQIQKVRNEIATDLHDEIGSNLSAIAVFSDLAGNPKKTGTEVAGLLKKISGYTQTSQDSMSDIVWMIDTKNDRLGALKRRMQYFANEVLEAQNTRVNFSADAALDDVKLSMLHRKAVYLIFKEAINNIVKYAEAKEVTVQIKQDNNLVHLSITDSGKGFLVNEQANKILKGGNGLHNMKKRADSINGKLVVESNQGTGTKITLLFSI